MTVSDTTRRPPDNPPPGEEWKPVPGVRDWYQFSHRGGVRSLDHTTNGRFYTGQVLNPRLDGDGYKVVNITLDDGTRKHGVSVARLVLLAHAGEPPEPGMQACHGPGGQLDNRYPENLRWDTDDANREDWRRDNPPRPRPLKRCARCDGEFDGGGKRCHPCVVEIGERAAVLLAGETDLEVAAQQLDYPSAAGLFRLAVRYGGLHCFVMRAEVPEEFTAAARAMFAARHRQSRLQRVKARWLGWLQDGDAQ